LDIQKVIRKLNWFYSLELNQVDLYSEESRKTSDQYLKKTLERIANIEQQHAETIAQTINELGKKPTAVGNVLAPALGKITGKSISMMGMENLLKFNIILEKKAMKDYRNFILKIHPTYKELAHILYSNLIDEDLHIAWFTKKLKKLNSKYHKTEK